MQSSLSALPYIGHEYLAERLEDFFDGAETIEEFKEVVRRQTLVWTVEQLHLTMANQRINECTTRPAGWVIHDFNWMGLHTMLELMRIFIYGLRLRNGGRNNPWVVAPVRVRGTRPN